MTYVVKEIFYSIQGEGANVGCPAVFIRFAGCNLWTGHERDRAKAACSFCDTVFVGDDVLRFQTAQDLLLAANAAAEERQPELVILTGGEPSLQVDAALVNVLRSHFRVAIETNGTNPLPPGIQWVCVSPKAGVARLLYHGAELKVVWPQALDLSALEQEDFDYFFLQPMDGPDKARNTQLVVDYCLANPKWRVSLQTHKYMGLR